jgi:hypothetical protein
MGPKFMAPFLVDLFQATTKGCISSSDAGILAAS